MINFKHLVGIISVTAILLVPGTAQAAAFRPGEVIRYAVKQGFIKAGEATLEFRGETYRDGRKYTLIIFNAKGFNFRDEERIFVDGKTFLPQLVLRDLNIFGSVENIMEEYDQAAGTIRITKVAGGRSSDQLIQKKGPVENIFAFLYRYRLQGDLDPKASFSLNIPTMDLTMSGEKERVFNTAGTAYPALLISTVPAKYSIWMDKGLHHLPLRIGGAIGIANTMMTMIEYKE